MKLTAKLLCLCLALCVALSFGACNKTDNTLQPTKELPKDTATIYYLSGAKYGEKVYTLDQLDVYSQDSCYIFFDTEYFTTNACKLFAFICELAFDVYLKKRMIEQLCDELRIENPPTKKK